MKTEESFMKNIGYVEVTETFSSYNRRAGNYTTKSRVFKGIMIPRPRQTVWDEHFILVGPQKAHFWGYVKGKRFMRSPAFGSGKDFDGEVGKNVEIKRKPGELTQAQVERIIEGHTMSNLNLLIEGLRGKGSEDQETIAWKRKQKEIAYSRRSSRKGPPEGKLDKATKDKANKQLAANGLDGNTYLEKSTSGYVKALNILSHFGIELGEIVDSFVFNKPSGRARVELAFTNKEDSFSPTAIWNTELIVTWHQMQSGKFESIAYLS